MGKNLVECFTLDDLKLISEIDKSNMLDAVSGFPEQIKNVSKEIISEFIKGFADSEASVRLRKGQSEISISSGNIEGLKDLQKLLKDVYEIRSYVRKQKETVFVLCISNYISLLKYYNEIGFIIKRKQDNL